MRRVLPRNKNGSGRSCKNRVNVYFTDEQIGMIEMLSKKYNLSQSDLFRKLLEDKFNEQNSDIF